MSAAIYSARVVTPARSSRFNSRDALRKPPAVVSHRRREASSRVIVHNAYGESKPDGTWVENEQNTFGKLINLAKGQREIVQAGTPALRQIAEEIPLDRIDSASIQELIQEMTSLMRNRGCLLYTSPSPRDS